MTTAAASAASSFLDVLSRIMEASCDNKTMGIEWTKDGESIMVTDVCCQRIALLFFFDYLTSVTQMRARLIASARTRCQPIFDTTSCLRLFVN